MVFNELAVKNGSGGWPVPCLGWVRHKSHHESTAEAHKESSLEAMRDAYGGIGEPKAR
jgi:hypothetical protein